MVGAIKQGLVHIYWHSASCTNSGPTGAHRQPARHACSLIAARRKRVTAAGTPEADTPRVRLIEKMYIKMRERSSAVRTFRPPPCGFAGRSSKAFTPTLALLAASMCVRHSFNCQSIISSVGRRVEKAAAAHRWRTQRFLSARALATFGEKRGARQPSEKQ